MRSMFFAAKMPDRHTEMKTCSGHVQPHFPRNSNSVAQTSYARVSRRQRTRMYLRGAVESSID